MRKLTRRKTVCALLIVCTATAMAATAQTFESLANFRGPDGVGPNLTPLMQGINGNLFGTTYSGGRGVHNCGDGCGVVFQTTTGGQISTVYDFCAGSGCTDGYSPFAGVVQGIDGNIYGTTGSGGSDYGTVFKVTYKGQLTTLHDFDGTDGAEPASSLIQAASGNFCGATSRGGLYDYGTVFEMTPDGALTSLHNFSLSDGASPSGVIQASDGAFYGTTSSGGDNGDGTVFRISPSGQFTSILSFNMVDGGNPETLIQASNGDLYGTTADGGSICSQSCGTIFAIDKYGL